MCIRDSIHMMVWSDDPKEGFLTREGIAAMRSKLTNTIFRDEMIQICLLYTSRCV